MTNTRTIIEQRLFERLCQEYSALGFDEAFLRGLSAALAGSDFVTEGNLEQVVADQKPYLEHVKKSADRWMRIVSKDAPKQKPSG